MAIRSHAGISKYSFHKSGICRSAFTREHGKPEKLNDRAMFKWKRNLTPSIGSDAVRAALLAFPTDYLSRETKSESKKVTWIEAAPEGKATFVELAYTLDSETEVKSKISYRGERKLISYSKLPDETALLVMRSYDEWENKDIKSPTTEESVFPNLVFSAKDEKNTGRPVRIIFGPTPKDGDALILQELGGYKVGT
ncbi:MAG: hypothetical protein KDF59_13545 [Nitrosomonas sp.]|nr:hypothetical protein [Nitrosomonas sp.]